MSGSFGTTGVQTISPSYVQVAIIIKLTFSYGGLYAHPRRSVCTVCLAWLHKGWVLCRVSYVATHPPESAGLSAAVSKIIFVLPVKGIVILDSEKDWPS